METTAENASESTAAKDPPFDLPGLRPQWSDLKTEFGDGEPFLVDGDALLWTAAKDADKSQRTLTSLEGVYTAEKAVKTFADRGGKRAQIVFFKVRRRIGNLKRRRIQILFSFQNHSLLWRGDAGLSLCRAALVEHFSGSISSQFDVLTQFQSPDDPNFVAHVREQNLVMIVTACPEDYEGQEDEDMGKNSTVGDVGRIMPTIHVRPFLSGLSSFTSTVSSACRVFQWQDQLLSASPLRLSLCLLEGSVVTIASVRGFHVPGRFVDKDRLERLVKEYWEALAVCKAKGGKDEDVERHVTELGKAGMEDTIDHIAAEYKSWCDEGEPEKETSALLETVRIIFQFTIHFVTIFFCADHVHVPEGHLEEKAVLNLYARGEGPETHRKETAQSSEAFLPILGVPGPPNLGLQGSRVSSWPV